MVLGGDVPLEEDILKKPIEFVNGWVEWSAQNREQIIRELDRTTGGSSNLFTVPANHTFYITNLVLDGLRNAVVGTTISLHFDGKDLLKLNLNPVDSKTTTISYKMPIKLEAGSILTFSTNSTGVFFASVQGWIQPKRLN